MEYASGGATSAQVTRGLGVSPTAVRNWKRSMLADDKERTMAHRTRTKSKARTAAAVDADMASLRREREGLAAELAGMRAERDRLFCFNVFSAGSSVFFRSVGGWFSPVSSSCSQ